MNLKELFAEYIELLSIHQEIEVKGLAIDSRKVDTGFVFFALPGTQSDGITFIPQAIQQGACAIFCEESSDVFMQADIETGDGRHVPVYSLPHLAFKIGEIASKFFGNPSHDFEMIGVTGTNGKSSIAFFLSLALSKLHKKTGLMGTLGNGFVDKLETSSHTTLNAIELQKYLAEFRDNKVETVAMEVSSHGLSQGRVNGCHFDIAVFTNLTHEHLDYHGDMHHYGQAKKKLFQMSGLRYCVINIDDSFGFELFKDCKDNINSYAVTLGKAPIGISKENIISAKNIEQTQSGLQFYAITPWGDGLIKTSLFGQFNIYNILCVIACMGILQNSWSDIVSAIEALTGVPGRMQVVINNANPCVVVDYAHTPNALENALKALKEHGFGKVWCVFGCGGDRDSSKRSVMGGIAEKLADYLIITNDNPRTENPEHIATEILSGIDNKEAAQIILDRKQAIEAAISSADANDVVLIAGKGHETYQEVNGVRHDFSDEKIVKAYLA